MISISSQPDMSIWFTGKKHADLKYKGTKNKLHLYVYIYIYIYIYKFLKKSFYYDYEVTLSILEQLEPQRCKLRCINPGGQVDALYFTLSVISRRVFA